LARRADDETSHCYECPVYLSAMDHLLSAREREEALKFAVVD
jgi:hypothetical protein